jgi:hypothetical protein
MKRKLRNAAFYGEYMLGQVVAGLAWLASFFTRKKRPKNIKWSPEAGCMVGEPSDNGSTRPTFNPSSGDYMDQT